MRRKIGWCLFAVGGLACLIGMFGLAGFLAVPIDLRLLVLENDSQLIDWLVVWLVVWSIGLFLLAKKKAVEPGDH